MCVWYDYVCVFGSLFRPTNLLVIKSRCWADDKNMAISKQKTKFTDAWMYYILHIYANGIALSVHPVNADSHTSIASHVKYGGIYEETIVDASVRMLSSLNYLERGVVSRF